LSLAWAITEALHQDGRIAARTLFATHYHELTQLAGGLERLRNVQVTVKEADGEVIFLRKVVEGGCDSSYGIHVAKMAGVPEAVVNRAWEILAELESHGMAAAPQSAQAPRVIGPSPGSKDAGPVAERKPGLQVDLFNPAVVEIENPLHRKAYEELLGLDVNAMSPLQLMARIAEIQQGLKTGSREPARAAG
jgi:DNA mismatch repair protein MutS